jgi:hypothetical protein
MSTEDSKLKEDFIGLINTGDDMAGTDCRIKLNLSEVNTFSFYEGEIVVAEGFGDKNNKFNVNRIYKPNVPLAF